MEVVIWTATIVLGLFLVTGISACIVGFAKLVTGK